MFAGQCLVVGNPGVEPTPFGPDALENVGDLQGTVDVCGERFAWVRNYSDTDNVT
jgi:hypothetical protein